MKEIKIVSTSDLHGNLIPDLPTGDILTISGDICPVRGSHSPVSQMHWMNNHFIPWIAELLSSGKFKHVVFIAGNHDFVLNSIKKGNDPFYTLVLPEGAHYLIDNEIEIEGVRIYGTPWTPTFGNWAFMYNESILHNFYQKIPEGLDILLSHGPAYHMNDTILQYPERIEGSEEHIGSKALAKRVFEVSPKYVIFGHIHSGSHLPEQHALGPKYDKTITSVNVSCLDENYNLAYKPFEFSIIKE